MSPKHFPSNTLVFTASDAAKQAAWVDIFYKWVATQVDILGKLQPKE